MGKLSRFRDGSEHSRMKLILLSGLLMFPILSWVQLSAENRLYVDVVHYGNLSAPKDTIFIGGEHRFRIQIENDPRLSGISIPLVVYASGDAGWTLVDVNSQFEPATPYGGTFISGIEGSRWMSGDTYDGSCWELGGTLINDQLTPEKILFGGAGYYPQGGLDPGPLEPMIYIHFRPTGPWITDQVIGTLCIDSTTFQPCVHLVFEPGGSPACDFPRCWPVKIKCGDPTGDGDISVSDAVFIINYIFKGGPAPDPWQLGDANADGIISVGDVVYLLRAIFSSGPQPECPE